MVAISAHFPAFVTEMCGPIASGGMLASLGIKTTSALGAVAISLIGMTNIGACCRSGGRTCNISGNYTAVWWSGVGAFSAIVHLPIRERQLAAQPA